MNATRKTTPTRAALLVVAALSMLLSGLFIATASRSDAQSTDACPDGFSLTADESACFQAAVVSTTTEGCKTGQLTPDGSRCFTAARAVAGTGEALCPDDYSPDDSLNGTCARFTAATQGPDVCPDGTRGDTGACHILIAKGSAGSQQCSPADALAGGTVAGSTCVITGPAPVNGSSCPTSATVTEGTDGSCYEVLAATTKLSDCVAPYVVFGTACKHTNPDANDPALAPNYTCPTVPNTTVAPASHAPGGVSKISSCSYPRPSVPDGCPAASTQIGNECRRPVALTNTGLRCSGVYALVGSSCVRHTATVSASGVCPIGSTEDLNHDCRKPVADVPGPWLCLDGGTVNGQVCLFTTGFLIDVGDVSYLCDAGDRAVIGTDAVCLHEAPGTVSGVGCSRGVLSTDGNFCVLPRVDSVPVSPPVPSFTG